ncbi:MAG: hypothetical protein J0M21_00600 [Xanthomonadales bacterium]|nr:hypothetical protein [Xanthomonadales bacterium]
MKKYLIGGYAAVAFLFAIYGTLFGDFAYKGFAYNLGRAVVWPAIMFPSVGAFIGGVVMLLVVVAILVLVQRR